MPLMDCNCKYLIVNKILMKFIFGERKKEQNGEINQKKLIDTCKPIKRRKNQ